MSYIDTDNLSYVSKSYENEIRETAKQIYSKNIVANKLEEIHNKLNKLIEDLNKKYQFTQDKVYGPDGVDEYIKDTHLQIDNISIDGSDFISDEIKNTKSHPSINAFKEDRNYTAYKTYDFINKAITLDKDTIGLKFSDKGINDDDKVHTFRINLNHDETLKIVEFNITYRQNPNLVTLVDAVAYKEPSIQVSRVIKGRFFIIRLNLDEPQNIIVKSIIENSDNTSNIIDEKVIDVKSSSESNTTITRNGVGPEFDMYFKVADNDNIDICIAKIIPYKWMIQKEYVNVETKSNSELEFSVANSKVTGCSIDQVLYSNSANKYFVIDDKNEKIYITDDSNLEFNKFSIYDKIAYTKNIKLFNIDNMTFITNGLDTIVFFNDPLANGVVGLGFNARDIKKVSSGEIILDLDGSKIVVFDPNNPTSTIDIIDYRIASKEVGYETPTKFVELDNGVITMFAATKDKLYYQAVGVNTSVNKYAIDPKISSAVEYEIPEIVGWEAEETKFDILKLVDGSLSVILSYKKENNKKSVVINLSNLEYTGSTIEYKNIKTLEYFDLDTHNSDVFTGYIDRIKHTTLFDFGISDDNKLFIIDNKFIYDAIHFNEVHEDQLVYDKTSNSEVTENVFLGYSLDNSILYMEPEYNENKYFNSNNAFMQNIVDVFETKSGIFIADKFGIYELMHNKNLKTKFYADSGNISSVNSNITQNAYGIIICNSEDGNIVIKHSYDVYKISNERLRYKYTDLFNEDWQQYKNPTDYYDTSKKVIEFKGIIYFSIIDRMSSIHNTSNINNMIYDDELNTFKDINPYIEHKQNFTSLNSTESTEKTVPVIPFTFTVNKYGIVNYHGFETPDVASDISDINAVKSYILTHKPGDGLTFNDFRKVVENKIREEALGDLSLVEKQHVYTKDESDKTSNLHVIEPLSEGNNYPSYFAIDYIKTINYSNIEVDFGKTSLNKVATSTIVNYNLDEGVELITVKELDIGVFFITFDNENGKYKVYYTDRETYRKIINSDNPEFFTEDNLLTINEKTQFDIFDNVNDDWVIHYTNDKTNENFIILTIDNIATLYNIRDTDGLYTKPFSVSDNSVIIERPDIANSSLSEGDTNKSKINSVKIMNNLVYLWNHNANSGIYVYDRATIGNIKTVAIPAAVGAYTILDFVVEKNNNSRFLLAINYISNNENVADLIVINGDGSGLSYVNSNELLKGCYFKFVEFNDKYIIGSFNKTIVVDANNISKYDNIILNSIKNVNFIYKILEVNGEVFALTVSKLGSNGNCGFYHLNLDNNTSDFVKINRTTIPNEEVYEVVNITGLGLYNYRVLTEYSTPELNRIIPFVYISKNPVKSIKSYVIAAHNNDVVNSFSFTTTLSNGDNIGLDSKDDSIIKNNESIVHINEESDTDIIYTQINANSTLDSEKTYVCIDGDGTKWSPFSFSTLVVDSLDLNKFNTKIKLFKFEPNNAGFTTRDDNFVKVDVDKLIRPIPGIDYYTNIGGIYSKIDTTIFEDNKTYYRLAGKWTPCNFDANNKPNINEIYYYSNDIKYVSAGIVDNKFSKAETIKTINEENENKTIIVYDDNYDLYEKETVEKSIVRKPFSMLDSSDADENNLKSMRFVNPGCIVSKDDRLAIPVVHYDGNAISFKSLVYNAGEEKGDSTVNGSSLTTSSPYAVFPIYKEFNTSLGKFVIYKQDSYVSKTGENYEYTSPNYSLGVITNDYKRIISIVIPNSIRDVNNVKVFEDGDGNVFVSKYDTGIGGGGNITHVNKLNLKLDEADVGSSDNDVSFSGMFEYAFVDDNKDFIIIDTKTKTGKFIAYKRQKGTTTKFDLFFEVDSISTFTPLYNGLVTRNTKDDLHDFYMVGNGNYNMYKYVSSVDEKSLPTFVPVCIQYSNVDSPINNILVDNDNNLIVKFTGKENNPGVSVKIDLEENISFYTGLLDWDIITKSNDKLVPNMYYKFNSNGFFSVEDVLFTNNTEREHESLVELPKVTCLPIVINEELYFNNCKANEDDLTEDHSTDYVAYDSDGVTVLNNHVYFDKMYNTDEGIFGIYNNEIFRNDIHTNGNGFIKVGNGILGSDFTDIIETKHGVFFIDNRNVKIYNPETNNFDSISQELATTSNNRKINFAKMTNEGLIIATVCERICDPLEDGVKDTKLPGAIHWYDPTEKKFKNIFKLLSDYEELEPGANDHITDITETSKGLFVVINKTTTTENDADISSSFDYSNVACRTYLVYNKGYNRLSIKEILVSETTVDIDESDEEVTTKPADGQFVFETSDGIIYLYGHAWYHKVTNTTDPEKFMTRYQLVRERKYIEDGVTETEYIWKASEHEDFGQNVLGQSPMYNNSDGSEEIVETRHGFFLIRTHRSQQNPTIVENPDVIKSSFIIKLAEHEDYTDFNDFGDDLVGLVKNNDETISIIESLPDNLDKNSAVKLFELNNSLYLFIYNKGTVEIRQYNDETLGFTTVVVNTPAFDIKNHTKFSGDYIKDFEVFEFNGVLFFKLFNNQVYRLGNWKLTLEDIKVNSKKHKNEVLYDLKITFENPELYNNLPEDTTNSEIDKFVIKEVGIVNLTKTKIEEEFDEDTNSIIEKEVYDNDPNSDIFRHITQFFMPHNYYNRSNGYVDNIIMDPKDPSTGLPKEYSRIKNLKQLYKEIYKGFDHKNLINTRFLKENQNVVTDTFVHKTNKVLGDIEDYIKNTDSFRIELRVYPTECSAANDMIIDSTVNFDDTDTHKDRNIINIFAPEC